MKKLFVYAILCSGLIGCSKDPMQKLASDTVYADLNGAFWSKQYDEKTPLWNDAFKYCQEHNEKPNCPAVLQVNFFNSGNTNTDTSQCPECNYKIKLPH